jgi:hypothetical protein
MNLLTQTYFELARAKDEDAIPVIKAMLTQAVLMGEAIPLSYWQTVLRLKGAAVAELLPDTLVPDNDLWNAIFAQKDPKLIQQVFAKHPNSLHLDYIDDEPFEALTDTLQLSLTKENIRSQYTTLHPRKLKWMLKTQREYTQKLLESQGLREFTQDENLLPLVDFRWLIQRLENDRFKDGLHWKNLMVYILPKLGQPLISQPFINALLLSQNQFPSSRENHHENAAVVAFKAYAPKEYMEWLRLQHLGGDVKGDLVTNIPHPGFNTLVTVAPIKQPDMLWLHYTIVAEDPALLQTIDPTWENAIFRLNSCRTSLISTYLWPAIRTQLTRAAEQTDIAQYIVAESLTSSPSLFRSTLNQDLPWKALEVLADYDHKGSINQETPVEFIAAVLQKIKRQASKDALMQAILQGGHRYATAYLIANEKIGTFVSFISDLNSLDVYKLKPHPDNVEPLIQLCITKGFQDYGSQYLFRRLIAYHPEPPVSLLQEAVMQNCSRFKTRHLKDWEVVALARMAKMVDKEGPMKKLEPIITRRKLDISQPLPAVY